MSSPQHSQRLAEPRRRGLFRGRVLFNHPVCPEHYRLRLHLARFPATGPGQFINVRCEPAQPGELTKVEWPAEGPLPRLAQPETTGRRPLLRRPFSLAGRADRPDGSVEIDIVYRLVGAGTAWLSRAPAGSEIDILGPLGNGFTIPDEKSLGVLVGGGTGIAMMPYLAEALTAAGKEAVAFAGARTGVLLPLTVESARSPSPDSRPTMCAAEFSAHACAAVVATDDGSVGFAGMVHEALGRWLDQTEPNPADLVVYACGPEEMMRAVAGICAVRRIQCQLALERHMACGMGTCQGCAVKVKADDSPGWRFALACKDGPVFDAKELIWE